MNRTFVREATLSFASSRFRRRICPCSTADLTALPWTRNQWQPGSCITTLSVFGDAWWLLVAASACPPPTARAAKMEMTRIFIAIPPKPGFGARAFRASSKATAPGTSVERHRSSPHFPARSLGRGLRSGAIAGTKGDVGRGVAVFVAAGSFLACAPAWGSTDSVAPRDRSLARVNHAALAAAPPASLRQAPLRWNGSPANAKQQTPKAVHFVLRGARPKAHLTITPGRLSYLGGRVVFKISSPHATVCTLSSKPRFWSGPNPTRVKCHGRATVTLPAVDIGLHWTFKLRARNAKGQSLATRKLVLRAPPFAISSNWSGYVVPSASPVTQVSGRFTVSKLNCSHTKNAGMSSWVGSGGTGTGATPEDLLQTGVRSMCVSGVQHNDAGWWEEYPE